MKNHLLWILLIGLVSGVPSAHSQATDGSMSGTVSDISGAVLPGAEVVILNEETGIPRTVRTDAAGRYFAPALSLGRYRVTASVSGFQTEIRTGGSTLEIPVRI